jgi:hypothetical protein
VQLIALARLLEERGRPLKAVRAYERALRVASNESDLETDEKPLAGSVERPELLSRS